MFLTAAPEATGMTEILAAMTDITTVVGNVFSIITGNALLTFFCGCGVLAAGIGVFITIKGAAH